MANDKILPAHVLAGYVWELWKQNLGVDTVSVNGRKLARIAPIADEPDLSDANVTYILYGFAENENNKMNTLHTGQFAMRILSKDFSEMTQLIRLLANAFEIEDESAQNLNWWASKSGYNAAFAPGHLRFTSVCVSFIEAADAATTEGGKMEGVVSLKYGYTLTAPVKKFAGSGWSL